MMVKSESKPSRRPEVTDAVLHHAAEHPQWGQARVAESLVSRGLRISAAGVRWIWQRHGLETAVKRVAALKKIPKARLSAEQQAAVARIEGRGGRLSREAPLLAREHLLAVAVREFSRRGFARTSVRCIAEAAGIQPGSVYYHFASKDDLFVAAHAAGMREVTRSLEEAIAPFGDPWQRLEAACTVHIRHLVSGNDLTVWTGASLFLFSSPEIQRQLRADRDRFEGIYRKLIDRLQLPAGIDRRLLRLQLLGALNWTRTWYRPGRRTPAEIAGHLVRVLRRSLDG